MLKSYCIASCLILSFTSCYFRLLFGCKETLLRLFWGLWVQRRTIFSKGWFLGWPFEIHVMSGLLNVFPYVPKSFSPSHPCFIFFLLAIIFSILYFCSLFFAWSCLLAVMLYFDLFSWKTLIFLLLNWSRRLILGFYMISVLGCELQIPAWYIFISLVYDALHTCMVVWCVEFF